MRAWITLLGGLTIWAAHFFALYGIASALPGRTDARWLAGAATLLAIAGLGLILRKALASTKSRDPLERWFGQLGVLGGAISLLAVVWQLPAVFI